MKKMLKILSLLCCLLLFMGFAQAEGPDPLAQEKQYLMEQARLWLGLEIPAEAEFGYLFPNEPQQGDYICRYTDAGFLISS